MARDAERVPTRWHLFEFEDLAWFPNVFRNGITDWLATFDDIYRPVVPLVVRLMEADGTDRVIDLCSGGSGPWEYLKPALDDARAGQDAGSAGLTLTDRYPNVPAFAAATARLGSDTDFRGQPVDARDVPDDLKGARTMFTAFHHLRPHDARAVLEDAARAGRSIGVFEHGKRDWGTVRSLLTYVPKSMLRHHFRAWKPAKRRHLPLVPFIVATSVWDAVVSQLRTYTPQELREMTAGVGGDDYRWEVGIATSPDRPEDRITYVIGYPVAA